MSRMVTEWKDEKTFVISGIIDESADFEKDALKFQEGTFVDFSGVTRINSCGVRQWIKAISPVKKTIQYINIPPIIVDQLSMVPEFAGSKAIFISFQALYVCEKCGHEETKLLYIGKDIEQGLKEYEEGPQHTCPKCHNIMEFDHSPEVYLSFLTKSEL